MLTPLCAALSALTFSQTVPTSSERQDFGSLGLEDLMKIKVFDSFKTPIPLFQTPGAVYIVSQEDIQRSGAATIPEALRLVPGVQVARLGNAYYSVTIRGFGNAQSNKLLVLLDGRSLYSPYQNAVYWEIEDVVMEDIDRIEVIRGPGGSIWGANAVDGIINIVTKDSEDTLGGLAVQSVGDLSKNRSLLQYGGKLQNYGAYRVYAKYGVGHTSDFADGTPVGDGSDFRSGGFRADVNLPRQSTLMMQGALNKYDITENQAVPLVTFPYGTTATNSDSITTSHFLAKWDRSAFDGAHSSVQFYYDLISYPYTNQGSSAIAYDASVEHRFAEAYGHRIALGGGYRYMLNGSTFGPSAILVPDNRRDSVANFFSQDDWKLDAREHLIFGFKLEHNNYTGFEIEPNVRYSFAPNARETFWASSGRAVRTPSQSEESIFSLTSVTPRGPGQALPTASATLGNPNLASESLVANELGYRTKLGDNTTVDFSAFYNLYSNLIYLAPGTPFFSNAFGALVTVDPLRYTNGEKGQTMGFEVSAKVQVTRTLRSEFGFSTLQQSHFAQGTQMGVPLNHASLHLAWDPVKKLEIDTILHWYDAILNQPVPAYTKLDVHANWSLTNRLELGFGAYDLFEPRHIELGSGNYLPRSFMLDVKFRF